MSSLSVVNHTSAVAVPFDRRAAIEIAVEKRNTLIEFVRAVMQTDVDYGAIPGTDKPTLLKPGAEKLCTLFNYLPRYEIVEKVEDWTGENHKGEAFFFYHYRCLIADQSGQIIATGEGSVNSWEKKYRYRDAKPVCPQCGQMTVNRSKDSGYYCWKKIGGCGATFADGDPQITSQPVGKIPNPDIFDQVNTMMKMSQKRSLVSAVLLACNASEFFTQDVEDMNVINAEIVTNAPTRSRPAPIQMSQPRPTAVQVESAPINVIPATVIDAITTRTGHSPAQVFSIAAAMKINPDLMSAEDWHNLRNALLGSWAYDQRCYDAKKHALNAAIKAVAEAVPFDPAGLTDGEAFEAVAQDVEQRKVEKASAGAAEVQAGF